jgi:hypothetical protein
MTARQPSRDIKAGYSGTPLVSKLGIKPGSHVLLLGAPDGYREVLQDSLRSRRTGAGVGAPRQREDVRFVSTASGSTDLVHTFCTRKAEMAKTLAALRRTLSPIAVIWVSWPKKSSRVETDITEDTVRKTALPLGLVDVKVCAIDDVWSGLKLVVRKELR